MVAGLDELIESLLTEIAFSGVRGEPAIPPLLNIDNGLRNTLLIKI